jgi:SAM-dependent methyltransferase
MTPASTVAALYQQDLAHVHHAGFGEFARATAPGVLALLHRHRLHGGRVVDLGCGAGILARQLARAGYDVLGIDLSGAMIRIARETAPLARFRRGSLYTTPLPRCMAVTALGEALTYPPSSPARLRRLFRGVFAALEPGGIFLFDLIVAGTAPVLAYRTWHEGEDWLVLVHVDEDRARETLQRDITVLRRENGAWRRSGERHRVRLYRTGDVTDWLEHAGFSVTTSRRLGRHVLAPRRLVFVARKPVAHRI